MVNAHDMAPGGSQRAQLTHDMTLGKAGLSSQPHGHDLAADYADPRWAMTKQDKGGNSTPGKWNGRRGQAQS